VYEINISGKEITIPPQEYPSGNVLGNNIEEINTTRGEYLVS
jgi:hypothetical protein